MTATITVDPDQINGDGTRTIKFTAVPVGGTTPYTYAWDVIGTYRSLTGDTSQTLEVVMQSGDNVSLGLTVTDSGSPTPCTATASGDGSLDPIPDCPNTCNQ